jgi:hypothetical protein
LESKGTRVGWLEKVFRVGQDPQRVVVPIIIIIIKAIRSSNIFFRYSELRGKM